MLLMLVLVVLEDEEVRSIRETTKLGKEELLLPMTIDEEDAAVWRCRGCRCCDSLANDEDDDEEEEKEDGRGGGNEDEKSYKERGG